MSWTLVSESPKYVAPPSSNSLKANAEFASDDVNIGCVGGLRVAIPKKISILRIHGVPFAEGIAETGSRGLQGSVADASCGNLFF